MRNKLNKKIKHLDILNEQDLNGNKQTKRFFISTPTAWKHFKKLSNLNVEEDFIFLLNNVQISEMNKIKKPLDIQMVVSIGGGMVCDAGKYLAKKWKKPNYIIPSILSTTAWLNSTASLKQGKKVVHKKGRIDKVIIFDPLIRSAPKRLNYGGLADILCGFSSLGDWKLAANAGKTKLKDNQFQSLSSYFLNLLNETKKMDLQKIINSKFIADTMVHSLALCYGHLSERVLDGGEHLLYYYLEESLNRPLNHGRIIAINTLICLKLQKEKGIEIINPNDLKSLYQSWNLFDQSFFSQDMKKDYENACLQMWDFVREKKYPYSIWNEYNKNNPLSQEKINIIISWIISD